MNQTSFHVITEEDESEIISKTSDEKLNEKPDDPVEFTRPFIRPVMRRNKTKSVRPLSESIDYNQELMEKLEAPTLRRFNSMAPEERFKRSSLR